MQRLIIKGKDSYTCVECPDCVQSSGYVRDKGQYVRCTTCEEFPGVVIVSIVEVPRSIPPLPPVLSLAAA